MRVLVVGAGSTGGYFGGRLLAAGRDITFLVRPRRAEILAERGLVIHSPAGDLVLPSPPTVTANAIAHPFDAVILSCKAYDLDEAMESIAPAVGPETVIIPLLNGMRHIDLLEARFGSARVLGGLCLVSTVLNPDGSVFHFGGPHSIIFGSRDGVRTQAVDDVSEVLSDAGFDLRVSDDILQDMWEKWVFLATAAGITSLMRSSIGDILAAGAGDVIDALHAECTAIARAAGHEPRTSARERARATFTLAGSNLTASMFRDIQAGARVEADHVIGDLLRRAGSHLEAPVLRTAFAHLKTYEARRQREMSAKQE